MRKFWSVFFVGSLVLVGADVTLSRQATSLGGVPSTSSPSATDPIGWPPTPHTDPIGWPPDGDGGR